MKVQTVVLVEMDEAEEGTSGIWTFAADKPFNKIAEHLCEDETFRGIFAGAERELDKLKDRAKTQPNFSEVELNILLTTRIGCYVDVVTTDVID